MQTIKKFFSVVSPTMNPATTPSVAVQVVCNYNNNYYGDQVCKCEMPAPRA